MSRVGNVFSGEMSGSRFDVAIFTIFATSLHYFPVSLTVR